MKKDDTPTVPWHKVPAWMWLLLVGLAISQTYLHGLPSGLYPFGFGILLLAYDLMHTTKRSDWRWFHKLGYVALLVLGFVIFMIGVWG